MAEQRQPLIIGDSYITVPAGSEVEQVMAEWAAAHLNDLAARLAPTGLTPADLALPEYHRVVYVDEVQRVESPEAWPEYDR